MYSWKLIPFATALSVLQAQAPPPASAPIPEIGAPAMASPIQGTAKAFQYEKLTGSTKIELMGTALSPKSTGIAKIHCDKGIVHIQAKVEELPPPSVLGSQYLTYVLWGISPDGKTTNLGELAVLHGEAKVKATETSLAFGMVVTAEPYFAVCQPSDAVVMENVSKGKVAFVDTRYAMIRKEALPPTPAENAPALDPRTPVEVLQARNAMRIARAAGAPALAGEVFGQAEHYLKQAETRGSDPKATVLLARQAVQRAEDARLITVQHQETERVAMEKRMMEDKLEDARREASRAAAAEADAHRVAMAAKVENEALQAKLREQLNAVLKTRATAKGLIVNMNGVLFRTGKAELAPAAREKLAKIAGILAAHKGLKIQANGYTDSKGNETFNQNLSEKRAMVTKDFLVSQGIAPDAIDFKGYGEVDPIAPNDTDEGRKENRRVELVVTGEGLTPHKDKN